MQALLMADSQPRQTLLAPALTDNHDQTARGRHALRRTATGMFISTQHNMVYGFDADSFGSAPMWSRSLGSSTISNDISTVRYCSDIPYEEARTILLVQGLLRLKAHGHLRLSPLAQWHAMLSCCACTHPEQQVTFFTLLSACISTRHVRLHGGLLNYYLCICMPA